MLKNKQGFLLIESLLLIEIVVVISFMLYQSILVFTMEKKEVLYDETQEDTLMRQAYE